MSISDSIDNPFFTAGQQKGACDFCEYLRGKIPAETLMTCWETFQAEYPPALAIMVGISQ